VPMAAAIEDRVAAARPGVARWCPTARPYHADHTEDHCHGDDGRDRSQPKP
jgi:hypothetical protein